MNNHEDEDFVTSEVVVKRPDGYFNCIVRERVQHFQDHGTALNADNTQMYTNENQL